MSDDIVARLRNAPWTTADDCNAAADEIERLRVELDGSRVAFAVMRDERDEARRRVCEDAIRYGCVYRRVGRETVRVTTPQEVAEVMEWDCYREEADDE